MDHTCEHILTQIIRISGEAKWADVTNSTS